MDARIPTSNGLPGWLNVILGYRSLFIPVAVIGLLAVIVVPLPPVAMDLLIAANLALAAVILLTTLFIERPLDFSVFPSLLLGTTLFRLVLNIATTRLILAADAPNPEAAQLVAGRVIASFSSFVAGNSLVVGLILFIILVVVQFVVITKGATRISEVAARFTLDGMPGKQMAIDADLNAGLINEQQARQRREAIAQEADFYGAMDGAAKFVRGDAIAGIIITIINIIGGFAIGAFIKGWSLSESLEVFTRLTIGDGLVTQIPALVVSIASGLIVTRSSSRADLGTELSSQLMHSWRPLAITSGFLALMAFTGLPAAPLLALAGALGVGAYFLYRQGEREAETVRQEEARQAETPPAPVEQSMSVDAMELEVGYSLVRLVDTEQGGDLLSRISMIRRQLAAEMGLVMPPVRIRDNMQLDPYEYQIKIRGNGVARGMVYPEQLLAMDSGLATEPIDGARTREPAFGLPAIWIEPQLQQRAETLNYTVVDPSSVLATHLTEIVKRHAPELLTREETNNLIQQLKDKSPRLVEEVITGEGAPIKPGQLQKVLQNLLAERVPVRDLENIIETLGDWASRTSDLDILTEYVRNALRRSICQLYVTQEPATDGDDLALSRSISKLYCVSLDQSVEDLINGYIQRTQEGTTMSVPPAVANRLAKSILDEVGQLTAQGHHPVVLASPQVRAAVRKLVEPHLPTIAVLGYNEIEKGVEVESVGFVQLESAAAEPAMAN
ncbi:MAG: flagellar biosynthesis protein FlhA [Phycisphaeraceae bacterium]|nr:flagellar biosynthesis protein FlhA [Phycisphaeraceae bacterium]